MSIIYEELGEKYTTYTKAGWINGSGKYYDVRNDAGIVISADGPYVLVVLSSDYTGDEDEEFAALVKALDAAHDAMSGGV